MRAAEQLSGVRIEYPEAEPQGLAVFVPGFGDTPDGPFGKLLRRRLIEGGLAVASVDSAEPIKDAASLQTVPLSVQTGRVLEAIDRTDPALPVHGIGMSQGGFVASEAFLMLGDESNRKIGKWFAVNTPATHPVERLEARMFPMLSPIIKGVVQDQPQHVAVSFDYWEELAGLDPLAQLEEAYRNPAFNVVLADRDEVLRDEAHHMAQTFEVVDPDRLHIINGANHHLTSEGGRHRRDVVGLIVGHLIGQK